MCGYMRLDRIRNEVAREKIGAAPAKDKMRETRLRWFGHLKRMSENAPVKRCETINFSRCMRGKGRPKKSCNKVIKNDLKLVDLIKDMSQDRSL